VAGPEARSAAGASAAGGPDDLPVGAADSPLPLAERRVCTVLFVDLVGFTPLAEQRDPEEIRELLSRYFDAAQTVIIRFGGVVEKFIGDAVMAIWGAPVAAEGDAERAVRAALDVVRAVADLGREADVPELRARAGIVTGEVAVTVGKVAEGMVLGDSVNTASRIQSAAPPGAVLVDDATWRVARSGITFSDAGLHELKGKSQRVPLWQAERVTSTIGGAQRSGGLEAPLSGRDAELRMLKESFHACVDRCSPRLVAVSGPAGVGKSRLGWEFEKYADGLAATVWWHRGRCLTYGDVVAFGALAEMVRQRLGIAEEDPPSAAGERLASGLVEFVPDVALREYVLPRLARLIGVGTPAADLGREELFAGWRVFFEQLATSAPVVLLVEDLQHADEGFLEFLDHLLDRARGVPIFVLTLGRPEFDEQRAGWGSGRRNGTTLALEPLGVPAMDAMLEGLVPQMPSAAKSAIAAQAQGIPLYAIETVRMLVDRGVVQPIGGSYQLVGELGELAVPDTLQSLLAARLDALPGEARRLVSDAAVIGSTFPLEALVAVSGLPRGQVEHLLAGLARREVISLRADPLSPERGQYGFVQTMFRQVAYDTLSRRERKSRHLAVSEHLAQAFPDGGEEVSEVIAHHLLDAMAAVPDDPDVGELRERAIATFTRAAERADRTGAPSTAARMMVTAAALREESGSSEHALAAARLWERAGSAAGKAGAFLLASEHFSRAGELFRRLGCERDAARASVGGAGALRRAGRNDEARTIVLEALTVMRTDPGPDTVDAVHQLAIMAAMLGDDDAEDLAGEALYLAQSLDSPDDVLADLLTTRGIGEHIRGLTRQAAASLREAARLARGREDHFGAGRALLNLADGMTGVDPAAALEAARDGLADLRRAGTSAMLGVALGNYCGALILLGRWDEVEEVFSGPDAEMFASTASNSFYVLVLRAWRDGTLDQPAAATLEALADSDDLQDLGALAAGRAVAAACNGDQAAALEFAGKALEVVESLGVNSEPVRWSWSLAVDTALDLGDGAEASRLLDWLDHYPAGLVPRLLRADRLRAQARMLSGTPGSDAGPLFEQAVGDLKHVGSPFFVARALLDHASWCRAIGEDQRAEQLATEAWAIAGRLPSKPLLDRASALLGDRTGDPNLAASGTNGVGVSA